MPWTDVNDSLLSNILCNNNVLSFPQWYAGDVPILPHEDEGQARPAGGRTPQVHLRSAAVLWTYWIQICQVWDIRRAFLKLIPDFGVA